MGWWRCITGLTKDIISFANSPDGGVIVIGKEESASGEFIRVGVNETQADSFETTKLATWVNNHCDPPVGQTLLIALFTDLR